MPKFVTIQNLEQYNSKINPRIQDLETDVSQVVDSATHMPIEATTASVGVVQLATAQDITNGTAGKVVDAKELADAIGDIKLADSAKFSAAAGENINAVGTPTVAYNNGTFTFNYLKGAKGDQGIQGPKGDKGDTGPQGPQGPKGDTPDSIAWDNVSDKPSTFTPSNHTHDDRYYTESEIDTKLSDKANATDLSNYLRLSGGNVTGNLTVQNKNVATEDFVKNNLGGGLEVGDIALAPLGIDETDNCRRYLNGQVILQSQFVDFTEKLKHAITLYPNLATTEQNWQSAVTLSPLGQCGKFVIDDENGTIRLPKVVNVMGALDLSTIGQTVEAGLPNITGYFNSRVTHPATSSGALIVNAGNISQQSPSDSDTSDGHVQFDASRSSSIYGNSTTVQQEAIKYPYFIQVATSNNEDVQIDTQVRLNNPFSLFMPYWSPIELNNLSWLRSNKQWNNGSVYVSAYEFLLEKYNAGTEQTETISGVSVTYILADNGMKIITDKSVYDALISASGSAWFFVLDTENTQFILPYTNGFAQFGNELGKFTEAGLPNITGSLLCDDPGVNRYYMSGNGAFYNAGTWNVKRDVSSSEVINDNSVVGFNASRSSHIYGKSNTVQPNSVTGYLYFYVGEVEQDANIIATSGLAESISRKLDIEGASSVGMPSDRYVDLSVGASGSSYTAPADGWFYVYGHCTATGGFNALLNLNGNIAAQNTPTVVGYGTHCFLPSRKGDITQLTYNNASINLFRFIYAEGAK